MHLHLEARGSLDTVAFGVLYNPSGEFDPSQGYKVGLHEEEVQY
jgi:hypothetical protein